MAEKHDDRAREYTGINVTLISHTMAPENLAGYAAATCTRSKNFDNALKHALAGGHESILEHISFTFRVSGISRACLAQLTRHRIASYSVESQRYVDMGDMPVVVPPSIHDAPDVMNAYTDLMESIKSYYRVFVKAGIPKEDARYVTPQAAVTTLVMTMNARELRHFFSLRCCNRAQWEIRAMADEMLRICQLVAPTIFRDAGPGCVRGKCPEEKPCGASRSEIAEEMRRIYESDVEDEEDRD